MITKISFKRIKFILLNFVIAVIPLIYLPYRSQYPSSVLRIVDNQGNIYNAMRDVIYEPKIQILYIVVALLLISLFFALRKEEIKAKWKSIYYPLALFALLITISTLLSPYRELAIYGRPHRREGLIALLSYIFIFIITTISVDNKKNLNTILKSFLLSGFIISCYGILQYFNLDPMLRDPLRANWSGRAFSTLGNPNFAGSYVGMLLPISFTLYMSSLNKRKTILLGIITTTAYAFFVSTGTRSAYLAIFLIIPLIIYLLKDNLLNNKKRLTIILIAFLLVTTIFNLSDDGYFLGRVSSIFSDGQKVITDFESADSAGSTRVQIYKTTLPLLLETPLFGKGPDTFQHVYPQELRESSSILDKAHSEYLQIGTTLGIPALIAYLWFLFKVIKINIVKLKDNNSPYNIALFLAVSAYLIQAAFNISVVAVAPVFWLILGLSFNKYKTKLA